jgi:hypothetical protein
MLARVRLRAGIVAVVAGLTVWGPSAAWGTSPGPRRCGPRAAPTIAASRQARVYAADGGVFGCSFVGGRSFRLGNTAEALHQSRVQLVVVAGADAAYALSSFGVDTVSATVVLRRLTDGRRQEQFAATSSGLVEGFQSVTSLALKSDGAVAWIGVANSIVAHREITEVHADASASGSANRILDSGPGIAPQSLRLHASTLTWRHGQATRRATLG